MLVLVWELQLNWIFLTVFVNYFRANHFFLHLIVSGIVWLASIFFDHYFLYSGWVYSHFRFHRCFYFHINSNLIVQYEQNIPFSFELEIKIRNVYTVSKMEWIIFLPLPSSMRVKFFWCEVYPIPFLKYSIYNNCITISKKNGEQLNRMIQANTSNVLMNANTSQSILLSK